MIGFAVWAPVAVFAGLLGWALFFANRRRFRWTAPTPAPDERKGAVTRTTILVPTPSGERIDGWLYHPGGASPPVVVMAPGLCGTKEGPLERFAWGFAEQGIAALLIDFRSFGGSEGARRHDTDLRHQVEDYLAVVAHLRAGRVPNVDASRIALWGTSFAGASAACAAAQSPVEALMLHVPYLGKPAGKPGFVQMLGYVGLSFAELGGDALAKLFGVTLDPVYITAYGQPGEHAFGMSRDGISRHSETSQHPFWSLVPKTYRGGWRNLMQVRCLQYLDAVDPEAALSQVTCPTLILAAKQDDMIAIADTRKIAARSPSARLVEFDLGHFDPYVDPHFAPNLAEQAAFLRHVLFERRAKASA